MSLPDLNKKAPNFKTIASDGKTHQLNDFRGKFIVLYFYPKDDTPGCTVEACSFRDNLKSVEKLNALILGVSPDNLKSHEKFVTKFGLPFLLLSDEDHTICKDYGVWAEKSMYGKKYWGVLRTTFIIDPSGILIRIFEKVKPAEHTAEVISFLQSVTK